MLDKLLERMNKEPLDDMDFPVYAQTVEVIFENDDYELEGVSESELVDCLSKAITDSDLREAESIEVERGNITITWDYPYPVEIVCANEVRSIADKILETAVSEVYLRDISFNAGEVVLRGYDKCNHDRSLRRSVDLLV